MKKLKISFLIPAHNEEKIIAHTLDNLATLPYKDYEILVGLDGCTDSTEEIVKNYALHLKNMRYFVLSSRQGKPEVVDFLVNEAQGDVLVINDADWIFAVQNKEKIEEFFSVFDNPAVGGIAESFPVEWDKEKLKKCNWVFKMTAYSSFLWFLYQKKTATYGEGFIRTITKPDLFLTNIFLKKLYRPNYSLGDDFERTASIMEQGYSIVLFDDLSFPRMIVSYLHIKPRDFIKQKIRTALARKQLRENGVFVNLQDSRKILIFMLKEAIATGPKEAFLILSWVAIMAYTSIIALFKKTNTQKGWELRLQR